MEKVMNPENVSSACPAICSCSFDIQLWQLVRFADETKMEPSDRWSHLEFGVQSGLSLCFGSQIIANYAAS